MTSLKNPSGIAYFPELSLRHRPELFTALVTYPFEGSVVQAQFGSRRGWIIIDPVVARDLLLRRSVPKARSSASRGAVGGYPSLSGAEFHRARSEVMVALARASADTTAMAMSLASTIGVVAPHRLNAPAEFTRWMLHDLAGGSNTPIDREVLIKGIAAVTANVEKIQADGYAESDFFGASLALSHELTQRVDSADTAFLTELRKRRWSTPRIVEELIGLALAGWESTAAAVGSALALGMGAAPTSAEITELLRLYPPSWLIVRQLRGDEPWGAPGDLALVSPWLTHRSTAWCDATDFNPERTDSVATFPFGVGPRRCPADRYAHMQIIVALAAFGGGAPCSAYPALIGCRSASFVPVTERIHE